MRQGHLKETENEAENEAESFVFSGSVFLSLLNPKSSQYHLKKNS